MSCPCEACLHLTRHGTDSDPFHRPAGTDQLVFLYANGLSVCQWLKRAQSGSFGHISWQSEGTSSPTLGQFFPGPGAYLPLGRELLGTMQWQNCSAFPLRRSQPSMCGLLTPRGLGRRGADRAPR